MESASADDRLPQEQVNGAEPSRILIVDDHPAVREGLAIRISRFPDLKVCGQAEDLATAVHLLRATHPDVAVVDITLKSGNGLELMKIIRDEFPRVRVLVCSMHPDSLFAERALRAGALGYINKDQATDSIVAAVRQVAAGKIYVSAPIAERLLRTTVSGLPSREVDSLVELLSDRELEAFQLIGQGMDTHQIAQKMSLSPKTVETYFTRIKEKLHIERGRQLIHLATQWVAEN